MATGSEVSVPPIPGLKEVPYKTSDEVLDLSEVPSECLVLGGGVVACELAQFLARVGSRVTIIQRSPRLLKEFSEEASKAVERAMSEEGIEILTGVSLKSFQSVGQEQTVVTFESEGQEQAEGNWLFVFGLRASPATRGLGLDEIGIDLLPSGHVRANEFQQTSLPHFYAAGDCAGPHEIVHVANPPRRDGGLSCLGKKSRAYELRSFVDRCFYRPSGCPGRFVPEQLRERGIEFLSASYPFDDHGKSILMEAKHGYVAVHAEKSTGRVLGAECVGKDAGELIHSLSLAVSLGATVHSLIKADWYHPTLSEIWTYPLEDLAEEISVQ